VRRALGILVVLSALMLASGRPASAQASDRLTVYAAASLKNALDEINLAFSRSRGGVRVTASYAASSTLARQIEQGAQADVFVSADTEWMDYAATRGLVRPRSRVDLLTNRLALVAPAASTVRLTPARGFPIARALGEGRLAMAGLDVPAGRYAKSALTALGVWGAVAPRVAYAENVRAALIFVSRGEAPLGIVYDTDALVEPKVRIVALFPPGSHPRITYPAAVTARSKTPAAGRYLDFLKGPRAAVIFAKYGFQRLGT
jgi:molybdate transport system substrate-binding protein